MPSNIAAFEKLMTNPTRIAIWAEIFRKPGITAKELIKVLDFKKTKMYYNLKEMLKSGLIEAEEITVKHSLILKKYRISKEFEKVLQKREELMEKPREIKLFSLFTILTLIQIEIRKTLNTTNEEILESKKKAMEENRFSRVIGLLFYSMDREQQFLDSFYEFLDTKIKHHVRDSIDPETYEKTYGNFFFGFIGPE
ncbi:MAG: winged helix-turn-helix domain-containing protein [Promethearchaeota archaeon]